jgi:ABC-type lipoprotein export system ATPase subunit
MLDGSLSVYSKHRNGALNVSTPDGISVKSDVSKVIALSNVCLLDSNEKNMKDPKYVLEDINLEVFIGEKITIVGPSGSGKSSLFKMLSLDKKYDSGSVQIFQQEINSQKFLKSLTNNEIGIVY